MDTGKYEGCRKTVWRCAGQPYTELAEAMAAIDRNGPDSCTSADVELWADAPDLLAEVKRLRKELAAYHQWADDLRAFTNSNGFDEMTHHLHVLMVEAGVMWKCPECGATYGEEQPCDFGCRGEEE